MDDGSRLFGGVPPAVSVEVHGGKNLGDVKTSVRVLQIHKRGQRLACEDAISTDRKLWLENGEMVKLRVSTE